jgi:hypothetical protein
MAGRGECAPDHVQEVLQMMSGRVYAIGLARVLFIFVVVIPALAVGLLYAIEMTRGRSSGGLILEYAILFLGTPLWLLCFAIALWQVVSRRARTVRLPFWVSPLVLVLLAADWRFVFSFNWSFLRPAWSFCAADHAGVLVLVPFRLQRSLLRTRRAPFRFVKLGTDL